MVAIGFRVFGAIWLSSVLSVNGKIATFWTQAPSFTGPWTELSGWVALFNAWDSGWYASIAKTGYFHPAYVFFPAYPALIRLVGLLTGNYWFGSFIVTLVFALASVVVFQLLAEQYMSKQEALNATILFATFPYVALFTTLGYSEALFLFSSLLAWFYHKKGKTVGASLYAGFAALTRVYGVLIVLPIILDLCRSRQFKKVSLMMIGPALALGVWALFCYVTSGNAIAFWTDESTWRLQLPFGLVNSFLTPEPTPGFATLLLSVSLFGYLLIRIWSFDRALWAYAALLFVLLVYFAGTISLPRYLSFIFPIWLVLRIRNPLMVAFCLALFIPVALTLWLYVVNGTFLG